MFEDLFEKKPDIGVSLKEPITKKGGMFEGLFEKKEPEYISLEKETYVSLTPDLKGIKIEDTGEIVSREKFTPEMKTAYKGLMGQLIEAQKEAQKEIPTTYGGIIKEKVKDIWSGIKAIPKTIMEWPGEVSWKEVAVQMPKFYEKETWTELVKTVEKIDTKVKWGTVLTIPKVRDKYIEENPQAVIDFVDDYERIVGPFIRKAYPTRIPLAVAEKIAGKKLAATYDELAKKNPVSTTISGLMGDIYNLTALYALTGGLGEKIAISGGIKNLFPTLTRYVPKAIEMGTTWGLRGVLDESISQFEKGEFKPEKIATEGGKEFLFGTLLAGPLVLESASLQIAGMGIMRGGWATLEAYLRDGTIDKDDLLNIGANTILGLVFGALGVKSRVSRIHQQKIYNLAHQKLVVKVGETDALLLEQMHLATVLSKKYPDKTMAEIWKMAKLLPKEYGIPQLEPPTVIVEQIKTQIPENIKSISKLSEAEQTRMINQAIETALPLIEKGQPIWESILVGLRGIGFPSEVITKEIPLTKIPSKSLISKAVIPAVEVKPEIPIIPKEVPVKPEVKIVEVSKEQIDVARGFARKFVDEEIKIDEFVENLKKTFPKVSEVTLKFIGDQARIFKEQDVSREKKVTDIGNYIEEQLAGEVRIEVKPKVIKPEVKPTVKQYGIRFKSALTGKYETRAFDSLEAAKEALEYRESIGEKGKIVEIPPKEAKPEVKPLVTKPKLPEIKKPPSEKGKLYGALLMPDPGVDKFLAEEVRPILNKAMEVGRFLWKTGRHIPEFMMRIIEPAKLVVGKPYATVIRGIHKPEARLIEFDQKRLEVMDTNISELEKWFDKFSDKDLGNLMLTRGEPTSAEAMRIQRDAIEKTPKELKVPDVKKAIQEIADFNYKFLQRVAGGDIHKVEDYFYGMYKDPKMVNKFLDYWRSTEKFTKQKVFPTVADAEAYGLELRYKNPVANLRAEFRAIAKLEGMNWMKEELLRTGKGIYIETTDKAPIKWEKVNDPVFRDLRVEPNLARLINNLIATNKITRIPPLNTLRKINNFLRTIKFIGSAFHLSVIGKQSVADSGYLGFAYKKTAVRGATFGFRKDDPIFRTPEYLEYIELGGGHKYSIEFEAKRTLIDMVDKINRGNYLGAFTKVGILPAKIPAGFVNFMFNNYIPKVKYGKYLDFVAKKEKDLGRMITDKEKIEIIKEGQNFYGMMNERLFGRSGTVTTALRFVFMAPGFAEGNYRTIIKAFSQWGVKGTYGAGRSRFNIVNSLILTAILATVGTLIFTKKVPEKPKKAEDIRDLFKIDTGYTDDKGRKIMIDLMTYDKDYWNITFNVLKGRPDKAVTESITRLGGMKAPTAEMLTDFALMLQGRAIYDWKEDEIMELTDPFLLKLQKLAIHEIRRLEPISMSVYKQLRNKDVDMALALVESALGVRPTKTEEDKRIQKITSRIYSLKGQQEELYQYLGTINKPKESIEKYNKMVNDVLDSKMVPSEMREEWKPKLLVDIDRLLSNKVYGLTDPMTKLTAEEKAKEIEKIKKYLQNFEVSIEEAEEQLKYYWKEHLVKDKWSKTHRENVRARKIRLEERY